MLSTSQSKNTKFTSKQQEKQRLPLHDDQEPETSYTLSSYPVIQNMLCGLDLLQETITKQKEKITSRERKPGHVDSNIVVLEPWFALENHVTDVLREQLDDQELHSCLPCLISEGIRYCQNETKLPHITENKVDKCQGITPADGDGKQNNVKKDLQNMSLKYRSLEKDGS